LVGNSYDNTSELSATTWRHVKFIEQFSGGSSITPTRIDDPLLKWVLRRVFH
jgi:hypothetical protein